MMMMVCNRIGFVLLGLWHTETHCWKYIFSRQCFIPVYYRNSVTQWDKELTNLAVNIYSPDYLIPELIALLFTLCFYCFSLAEKDESIKVTTCKDKKITTVKNGNATKPNKAPLTGTEVVHIFAKKRDLGELELYYLKEVDGDFYRYSVIRLPSSL